MAISNNKERIYISLEEDLMKILREEAKFNRRFPSDEIAILIEKYLKPINESRISGRVMRGDKIIHEYNKKD